MIHELRWYVLSPGRVADYLAAAGGIGRKIRGDRYGKLEAHWVAQSGSLAQVVHLWSFTNMAERDRLRGLLAQDERWATEFLPLLAPLVMRQDNKILTPVCELSPPAGGGHVYELRSERTKVGSTRAWLSAFLPMRVAAKEYGVQTVGVWQTAIGTLNEVVHLSAYSSLDAVLEARRSLESDPRCQDFIAASRSMLAETHSMLLTPSPLSPME
jgi:hypothetical protein